MVVLFCVSANLIENHSKHENENMFFMCFFQNAKHHWYRGRPGQNGGSQGGHESISGRSWGLLSVKKLS